MKTSTSKMNAAFKKGLISTAGLLAVLILWQILSQNYHTLILPSPKETYEALAELRQSGQLWKNTAITFRRTAAGYAASLILGLAAALLLRVSSFFRDLLRPVITVVQIIPPVIWLVLAVIWFGIADDLTPIFLIFIVTFPVIFINLFSGLQSIDLELVEMAKVYRCSKAQIVGAVYLPALVPHLISAVSLGLSFAWKSTIFAEFLGSSSGIGFALSMANANLETEKLFAWAVILIAFMFVVEYGVLAPLAKRVTRWKQHGEG